MCTFKKRGGALYYTYFFPNIFHNLFLKTRKIHRDVGSKMNKFLGQHAITRLKTSGLKTINRRAGATHLSLWFL